MGKLFPDSNKSSGPTFVVPDTIPQFLRYGSGRKSGSDSGRTDMGRLPVTVRTLSSRTFGHYNRNKCTLSLFIMDVDYLRNDNCRVVKIMSSQRTRGFTGNYGHTLWVVLGDDSDTLFPTRRTFFGQRRMFEINHYPSTGIAPIVSFESHS